MIVVTGEPRTGTSLQMLIIKNLGFDIIGEKDLNNHPDFNPTGMWEIRNVPYNGLQTLDKTERHDALKGDVIKMAIRGFMKSNYTLFDRMIFCIRDPRESIVSQRKQSKHQSDEMCLVYWLSFMGPMYDALQGIPPELMHIVDYGDVMWSPKTEVGRLAKYLGVEPTQEAIDCVRPDLYRSNKHKIKRCKLMKKAEKFYEAFRLMIK